MAIFHGLASGPAITNLLVMLGLGIDVMVAWRLLAPPRRKTPAARRWRPSADDQHLLYIVQHVLVVLGFLWGGTHLFWTLLAAGIVLGLTALSVRLVVASVPEHTVRPALALVLTASSLVLVGAMLLVRLVIAPDPNAGFAAGMSATAWRQAAYVLIVPSLVFAVVLVAMRSWRQAAPARVNRWRAAIRNVDTISPRAVAILAAITLALFALPLAGSGGGAALVFHGVATPEYAKVFFVVLLAVLVARRSYDFAAYHEDPDAQPPVTPLDRFTAYLRRRAYAFIPVGAFVVVAAISERRHDFGTIIPVFAAAVGVTWTMTDRNNTGTSEGKATWSRQIRRRARSIRAYRTFIVAGLVMLAVGAVVGLSTHYVADRGKVWADPWVYPWSVACVPVTTPPVQAPGITFCRQSMLAVTASDRSQESIALSAIADGGIWGRGIDDTASGVLPVGSTDYVVAVIWDKLGAVIVVLLAFLVMLLATALVRAAPWPPDAARPGLAHLVAAGLGAQIAGQFLFVFAATVNLVPDSGIPAPFLSRGGQATLALLIGMAIVVALAAGGRAEAGGGDRWTPMAATASDHRPRLAGVLAAILCVVAAGYVTATPYQRWLPLPHAYAENRPPCAAATDRLPDPERCSTDQIAYGRTRVVVQFRGTPGFDQKRPGGTWTVADSPALHGLSLGDMTDLLSAPGAGQGVLDRTYGRIVTGTVVPSLGRRLTLPTHGGSPDGLIDLTIDPALQHTLATAIGAADPATKTVPLAGGIVVLDPSSGDILAAVTGPGAVSSAADPAGTAAARQFVTDHDNFGWVDPDRPLNGADDDDRCPAETSDPAVQSGCWRWSYQAAPGDRSLTPTQRADLLRYVDGDATVTLPPTSVDRAFGTWYGFGSTFKVVLAAAYLSRPGTSPSDLLPAPTVVHVTPTVVIRNSERGDCIGVEDGQISLERALAVSCNTAFVSLAQRLGWPAIAKQAGLFGLQVGPCTTTDTWIAGALSGAVNSCVPAAIDDADIGNDALGGGAVQGTPLGMAAVMAAIANGGIAVEPRIVDATLTPGAPARVPGPVQVKRVAVSPAVAAELRTALSETAVDGTAPGLQAESGLPIWVKTGTNVVYPAGAVLPHGQFTRIDSWLVGFAQTRTGVVAFAAVVETRNQSEGAKRVRFLVAQILAELKAER